MQAVPLSGHSALGVSDLRVTYGPNVAVDGMSFSVNEGEIFGLDAVRESENKG